MKNRIHFCLTLILSIPRISLTVSLGLESDWGCKQFSLWFPLSQSPYARNISLVGFYPNPSTEFLFLYLNKSKKTF